MSLPPELVYGHVVGRFLLAVADSTDADRMPDAAIPDGLKVEFTPKVALMRVGAPNPATVVKSRIVCSLDSGGGLIDPQSAEGVWLVAGQYAVKYGSSSVSIPGHDIEVLPTHTEAAPLDLTTAMPPGGPVLTPSQYAELSSRIDALEAGGGAVDSTDDTGWQTVGLSNGWAGAPSVRRVGSQVYVSIHGLSSAAATSTAVGSIPAGYRPDVTAGGLTRVGYTFRSVSITPAGSVYLDDFSAGDGTAIPTVFTYPTSDPFP